MLRHPDTDIQWEIVSGAMRSVFLSVSAVLLVYFILVVLLFVDVLTIDSWFQIILWTLFSFVALLITLVHLVLNWKTGEKSSSVTGMIVESLALTLMTTLALFIVYIYSDAKLDSSTMTSAMEQFVEGRKHFFLTVILLSTAILFSKSCALTLMYRK